MSEQIPTEAEVVAGLARTATEPRVLDPDVLYSVVNKDGEQRVLDLERYLTAPRRTTGSVVFTRAESLIHYLKSQVGGTADLYASAETRSLVGVLNDHWAGDAGWGDWRASLQLQTTLAWNRWANLDGAYMGQVDFAEHLEDGLLEIARPPAARMLELAKSFHVTKKATADSTIRLDNGETSVKYVEQVAGRAGSRSEIAIPEFIELGLAPFDGCDAFKIRARFRYRLNNGELVLGYKLERPEDVLRAAFDEIVATVQTETGATLYYGTPRALPAR